MSYAYNNTKVGKHIVENEVNTKSDNSEKTLLEATKEQQIALNDTEKDVEVLPSEQYTTEVPTPEATENIIVVFEAKNQPRLDATKYNCH
jgi:hypothetical protein